MSEASEVDALALWRKLKARRAPLYPVTIVAARYGGSYEGGSWCAFNEYAHQLPTDHDGSDIECMQFWSGPEAERVGRGGNPADALADLLERVKVHGESRRYRGGGFFDDEETQS